MAQRELCPLELYTGSCRWQLPAALRTTTVLLTSLLLLSQPIAAAHVPLYTQHQSTSTEGRPQSPAASAKAASAKQDVPFTNRLAPGTAIERQLAGDERHRYEVLLAAGEYLQVEVEQQNIDVVITLYDVAGQRKLAEADGLDATRGPESLSFVAEEAGRYQVEIRPSSKDTGARRYTIRIAAQRLATPRDRQLVTAERIVAEANRLYRQARARQQGAADARQQAHKLYREALEMFRHLSDYSRAAATLLDISATHYELDSDLQQALDCGVQALPLFRLAGDRRGEATALYTIGVYHIEFGRLHEALNHLNQALLLRRAVSDHYGESYVLSQIGGIYQKLGDNGQAIDYFTQTLQLRRAVSDPYGEISALTNIGVAYNQLGDTELAIDHFKQALALRRAIGHHHNAWLLFDIGWLHLHIGDLPQALDSFKQVLPVARTAGDHKWTAWTLSYIGKVYNAMGEPQQALGYFIQALPLMRAVDDPWGQADTLSHIGETYYSVGDGQQALAHLNQVLPLQQVLGDSRGEARTLYQIARVLASSQLTEARSHVERALRIVESLRTKVTSQGLRASYTASVQQYYELAIDLLMRLHAAQPTVGYAALALEMSERARARGLLELLAEAGADIRQGVDPRLLERLRVVQSELSAAAERRTRLLGGKHTPEEAATIAQRVAKLTASYDEVQAQIRQHSPRYAALTQPAPLSLAEVQQQLDPDTVLLEYWLGEERSYLWAVTTTSIKSYVLPKRLAVEAVARPVLQRLTARSQSPVNETPRHRRARLAQADAEYGQAAAKLSRMLLGDVAAELGERRLLVVSDGALQYVPFAALPVPHHDGTTMTKATMTKVSDEHSLVEQHEIVNIPSASALAALRRETRGRQPAARTVAVLADPVFDADDARLGASTRRSALRGNAQTHSAAQPVRALTVGPERALMRAAGDVELADAGRLPRLLSSRQEAQAIAAITPAGERLQALDFMANRRTAMGTELAGYRIVHFATHGLLNSQHPELSGIVLSLMDERGQPQNGFLQLHEIYNLQLPVELVVLSACQTGLGKEIRGEGLVGLTRGFMYAGAKRVVASLWKVDDAATAELMRLFYQGMLREEQTPAQALRLAQQAMRQHRRWQSPFYWAGFVLQGEWQQ